jgi:hypothetical protein
MRYYYSELSSGRDDFIMILERLGIESIIDVKELNKITDVKEREKILSEKIDVAYRHVVFSMCVSKYAGITL